MNNGHRWLMIVVFFVFMLLHQTDKLLIGPLTTQIMKDFYIDEAAMGLVGTGALVAGSVLYPLWGYLYDRFARVRLISLASALWGMTTWLSAVATNFVAFLLARASTGIDDSSYPGVYSLISDYFGPESRGKIYGLLQLVQPVGYLVALVLALVVAVSIGWRNVYYITGAAGLIMAALILLIVREAPRGQSEPELRDLAEIGVYRFDRKVALSLFRKKALVPLFLQGFFGVFPWTVISFWLFRYLEVDRGYSSTDVLVTMVPAVLTVSCGYFVSGALGDWLFKRTPRGRLIVGTVGVISGAIFLFLTIKVPANLELGIGVTPRQAANGEIMLFPSAGHPARESGIQDGDILFAINGITISPQATTEDVMAQLADASNGTVTLTLLRFDNEGTYRVTVGYQPIGRFSLLFVAMICLTAFFIPFSSPNIVATVYDITLPEVRSTALAVQYFIENSGAAFAPAIAGIIAIRTSLSTAILVICGTAWMIAAGFLLIATYFVPQDVAALRQTMQQRADDARGFQTEIDEEITPEV